MPGQGGEFVPGQGGDYVAAQQQQQQVQEFVPGREFVSLFGFVFFLLFFFISFFLILLLTMKILGFKGACWWRWWWRCSRYFL